MKVLSDGAFRNLDATAARWTLCPMVYSVSGCDLSLFQGVANVALTTDVYSCSIQDNDQREVLRRLDKQRKLITTGSKLLSPCLHSDTLHVEVC